MIVFSTSLFNIIIKALEKSKGIENALSCFHHLYNGVCCLQCFLTGGIFHADGFCQVVFSLSHFIRMRSLKCTKCVWSSLAKRNGMEWTDFFSQSVMIIYILEWNVCALEWLNSSFSHSSSKNVNIYERTKEFQKKAWCDLYSRNVLFKRQGKKRVFLLPFVLRLLFQLNFFCVNFYPSRSTHTNAVSSGSLTEKKGAFLADCRPLQIQKLLWSCNIFFLSAPSERRHYTVSCLISYPTISPITLWHCYLYLSLPVQLKASIRAHIFSLWSEYVINFRAVRITKTSATRRERKKFLLLFRGVNNKKTLRFFESHLFSLFSAVVIITWNTHTTKALLSWMCRFVEKKGLLWPNKPTHTFHP